MNPERFVSARFDSEFLHPSDLDVGAGQEVVVSQHTEKRPGAQAVLKHLGSTVDVSKTWKERLSLFFCIKKRIIIIHNSLH